MKNNKTKSAVSVIIAIILILAAAVVIGWAFNNAIGPWDKSKAAEEPEYTVKVNEATGQEEYFDKDGNLSFKVNKEYTGPDSKKITKEVYSDANDQTEKIVYYKDDGKTIDRVDEWDGNNVSIQHIYENGADTGKYWEFKYNEDGRQTYVVNYDADKNVILKKETSYNKDKKPEVYSETDAQGNIISKTEYTYDKDGKEAKTFFYDAKGLVGYVEYQYDEKGQVKRMDEYKDDELIHYILYKFDKDGKCTEDHHYPPAEKK